MCVKKLLEHLQQMPLKSEVGIMITFAPNRQVEEIVQIVRFYHNYQIDNREYVNIIILSEDIDTPA